MACSSTLAASGVALRGVLPVLVLRKSAPASSAMRQACAMSASSCSSPVSRITFSAARRRRCAPRPARRARGQVAVGEHHVHLLPAGGHDLGRCRARRGPRRCCRRGSWPPPPPAMAGGSSAAPAAQNAATHTRRPPRRGRVRALGALAQAFDVGFGVSVVVQAGQVQAGQRGARGLQHVGWLVGAWAWFMDVRFQGPAPRQTAAPRPRRCWRRRWPGCGRGSVLRLHAGGHVGHHRQAPARAGRRGAPGWSRAPCSCPRPGRQRRAACGSRPGSRTAGP
jgi:hypothetical protein